MMAGKLRNGDDVVALYTKFGKESETHMIELYSAKSHDRIDLSACFTCSDRREYQSVNITSQCVTSQRVII